MISYELDKERRILTIYNNGIVLVSIGKLVNVNMTEKEMHLFLSSKLDYLGYRLLSNNEIIKKSKEEMQGKVEFSNGLPNGIINSTYRGYSKGLEYKDSEFKKRWQTLLNALEYENGKDSIRLVKEVNNTTFNVILSNDTTKNLVYRVYKRLPTRESTLYMYENGYYIFSENEQKSNKTIRK